MVQCVHASPCLLFMWVRARMFTVHVFTTLLLHVNNGRTVEEPKIADAVSSDVHQPRKYHFPEHSFGSKGEKRSFKASWFDTWPWLHYQETSNWVICFYCCEATNINLLIKGYLASLSSSHWHIKYSYIHEQLTSAAGCNLSPKLAWPP